MNYEIVEMDGLSGSKTTIYSVIIEDDEETLFDHFVKENITDFPAEVRSIVNRIQQMGHILKTEAEIIIQISKDITKRIQDREIYWSKDGSKLLGNLKFSDDEE